MANPELGSKADGNFINGAMSDNNTVSVGQQGPNPVQQALNVDFLTIKASPRLCPGWLSI